MRGDSEKEPWDTKQTNLKNISTALFDECTPVAWLGDWAGPSLVNFMIDQGVRTIRMGKAFLYESRQRPGCWTLAYRTLKQMEITNSMVDIGLASIRGIVLFTITTHHSQIHQIRHFNNFCIANWPWFITVPLFATSQKLTKSTYELDSMLKYLIMLVHETMSVQAVQLCIGWRRDRKEQANPQDICIWNAATKVQSHCQCITLARLRYLDSYNTY